MARQSRSRSVLLVAAAAALALSSGCFMAPAMGQGVALRGAAVAEAKTWGSATMQPNTRQGVTAQRIFGLGTSEILVILAVGAFFFGPDKLKELAGEAGKAAGDLKDVPKAFEEGMKEKDKLKAGSDDKEEEEDVKEAEVVEKKTAKKEDK
jgi:Sec-independent protein translocase protein TatA